MTSTGIESHGRTMASLARDCAERYPDEVAARYRDGDGWADVTFAELDERVNDLAMGLIGLGVQAGDRVSVLADTRFEWTVVDLAISACGAVVVPIYASNSPKECAWVLGDSGARVVICENPAAMAKIDEVRGELDALEHVVLIDGSADGVSTIADLADRGGSSGEASELEAELNRRIDAVGAKDPYLIIYTSGTTGRPKGVVLAHDGFAEGRSIITELELIGPGDVAYLYLPLAHVFAQVIQAVVLEVGSTLAFWGGDTGQIIAELAEVQPTVFPSVPRIFEKIYTMATGMVEEDQRADFDRAVEVGCRVHDARRRGAPVSDEDEAVLAAADEKMFGLVRGLFGGKMRFAISGAAPIAPEILRFFYAAGAPVLEGWGMTETSALGTVNLPDSYKFGTIGPAQPGVEMRIDEHGEILIRGAVVFEEYWNNPEATKEAIDDDGWLHTGDLGSVDEDGFFSITGRTKDIIITAGGKNLTPANLEGDLRASRWVSQAVMYADRKPYPVALITLDPETVVPWAQENGLTSEVPELADHEDVRALIQAELDTANAHYARAEQIKRFVILPDDFTQESGELTPTLKIKRNVVYDKRADDIERLYE